MAEIIKITGRGNERLKTARAVREGRDAARIFIEGVRLANEAVRSAVAISEAFVSDDFRTDSRRISLVDELLSRSVPVCEISDAAARLLSDTKSQQGIFLIAERPDTSPKPTYPRTALQIALYLHEINNPLNLGAILRTAEAAGVSAVYISEASADPFSPRSLRSSMGSAFRMQVIEHSSFDSIKTLAKENRSRVTAVDVGGKTTHYNLDWNLPRVLVLGSEAAGLPDEIVSRADEVIRIPMAETVESLNLAVACAVVLYEAKRQTSKCSI